MFWPSSISLLFTLPSELIPSSETDGTIAEMNDFFGKARRRNGAGTMTKEKRSQRSHSSGTLIDHEVLFQIPQQ